MGAGEIGDGGEVAGEGIGAFAGGEGLVEKGAEQGGVVEEIVGETLGQDIEAFAAFEGGGRDRGRHQGFGKGGDADDSVGTRRNEVVGFGDLRQAGFLDGEGDRTGVGGGGGQWKEQEGDPNSGFHRWPHGRGESGRGMRWTCC